MNSNDDRKLEIVSSVMKAALEGHFWKKLSVWSGPVLYSPALATEILDNCNNVNRTPDRTGSERRYADQMSADEWFLTTSGIGFDTANELTNGQGRLGAIKKSGKSVLIPTLIGLHPDSRMWEDMGRPRTEFQNRKLTDRYADRVGLSTVGFIAKLHTYNTELPKAWKPQSVERKEKLLKKYRRIVMPLVQAAKDSKQGHLSRGSVLAAIVRYIELHSNKGQRFMNDFYGDLGEGTANPFVQLRKYLVSIRGQGGGRGVNREMEQYGKTLFAINCHLRNEPCLKLAVASHIEGDTDHKWWFE